MFCKFQKKENLKLQCVVQMKKKTKKQERRKVFAQLLEFLFISYCRFAT